jgi:hypothetical protein
MTDSIALPAPRQALTGIARAGILATAALVVAVVGTAVIHSLAGATPVQPGAGVVPVNPAIEATWGVRVSQVAMTADGGLVDLRFVVLDPDKAIAMMSDVANLPVLRDEANGVMVTSTAPMGDDHTLVAGHTYFLLYRNTRGVIQPGTPVAILFPGGLAIDHVESR